MSLVDDLRVEVAKLQLEPGDHLVIRCNRIGPDLAGLVADQLAKCLPTGVKAIVLGPDVELEGVLRNGELLREG